MFPQPNFPSLHEVSRSSALQSYTDVINLVPQRWGFNTDYESYRFCHSPFANFVLLRIIYN